MNDLLVHAQRAAHDAASVIMSHYSDVAYEMKDDNSPVTIADRAAHECLMGRLSETHIPILSEEDVGVPLPYPEYLWIIDPLDGTKGFLKKTGDFSVMIALLHFGRPILAVVDAPVLMKQYYASRDGGSFLTHNGQTKRLSVSQRTAPRTRGLLSVNHAAPYMYAVMDTLGVTETVAVGSIGIKAGYIAEDTADFYLTRGALGEWDVCAPELILTEAGGSVTDTNGQPIVYGNKDHRIAHGLVMSNTTSHEEVLHALEGAA